MPEDCCCPFRHSFCHIPTECNVQQTSLLQKIFLHLYGSLLPSPEAMQIDSYIMDKFPHQNIGIKGYLSIGSNYTFGDKSAVVLSGDVSINMPVLSTD